MESTKQQTAQEKIDIYESEIIRTKINKARSQILRMITAFTIMAILESIAVYYSKSMTLLMNVIDLIGDTTALCLSYVSIGFAFRPKDNYYTFGYKKSSLVGAILANGYIIIFQVWSFTESVHRLITGYYTQVNPTIVLITEIVEIIINLILARFALMGEEVAEEDLLNMKYKRYKNLKEKKYFISKDDFQIELEKNIQQSQKETSFYFNLKHKRILLKYSQMIGRKNQMHQTRLEQLRSQSEIKSCSYSSISSEENQPSQTYQQQYQQVNKSSKSKQYQTQNTQEKLKEDFNLMSAILILLSNTAESIIIIISAIVMHFNHSFKIFDTIIACVCIILTVSVSFILIVQICKMFLCKIPVYFKQIEFIKEVQNIEGVDNILNFHGFEISQGSMFVILHVITNGNLVKINNKLKQVCDDFEIKEFIVQYIEDVKSAILEAPEFES